ncbi:MAG TPA: phasin family protein [Acidiphilium sp.]
MTDPVSINGSDTIAPKGSDASHGDASGLAWAFLFPFQAYFGQTSFDQAEEIPARLPVDNLLNANRRFYRGMAGINARNLEIARTLLDTALADMRDLTQATDMADLTRLQIVSLRRHGRQMVDIARGAADELHDCLFETAGLAFAGFDRNPRSGTDTGTDAESAISLAEKPEKPAPDRTPQRLKQAGR